MTTSKNCGHRRSDKRSRLDAGELEEGELEGELEEETATENARPTTTLDETGVDRLVKIEAEEKEVTFEMPPKNLLDAQFPIEKTNANNQSSISTSTSTAEFESVC